MKIKEILCEEVERVVHERLGGRRYARLQTEGVIESLLEWAADRVCDAGELRLRVIEHGSNVAEGRQQCYRCARRVLTQRELDRGINQVTTARRCDFVVQRHS